MLQSSTLYSDSSSSLFFHQGRRIPWTCVLLRADLALLTSTRKELFAGSLHRIGTVPLELPPKQSLFLLRILTSTVTQVCHFSSFSFYLRDFFKKQFSNSKHILLIKLMFSKNHASGVNSFCSGQTLSLKFCCFSNAPHSCKLV